LPVLGAWPSLICALYRSLESRLIEAKALEPELFAFVTSGSSALHVLPSTDNPAARSLRDQHSQLMAEKGRLAWRQTTGYGGRTTSRQR
jgi:hypothetical protein